MTEQTTPSAGEDVVVFPGQGAQVKGMGADFFTQFPIARATFAEAADATGVDYSTICFSADERLHLTEFTQPCVVTMEIAAYRVSITEFGLDPGFFGGHSLGEYTALVAAGAVPFADAIRLVSIRGSLMQDAVPAGQGAMAALIMDDILRSRATELVTAAGVEVANLNSPKQVVVSGAADEVEGLRPILEQALPDLTFVPLRISVPAHCRMMTSAQEKFADHVMSAAARFDPARAAVVVSNVTGDFHEPGNLHRNLEQQIASPVRWLDNMHALAAAAGPAGRIIEIGPRPALAKFFGSIGVTVSTVSSVAEMQALSATPRKAPAPTVPRPVPALLPPAARLESHLPPVSTLAPEMLGSKAFRQSHRVRLAYAAGGMGAGISSSRLVSRLSRAGLLGFLGTAGLTLDRVTEQILELRRTLPPGSPWGVNLTHDPWSGSRVEHLVDLSLRLDVPCVEVSGFTDLGPALVRLRLSGLRDDPDGVRPARLLMAKVSRPDVAGLFFGPPPDDVVRSLLAKGLITAEEARLAPSVTMADDICVEADPGGGTTGTAVWELFPEVQRTRDRVVRDHPVAAAVRLGAAGGLGTPQALAAVFILGADFALTGSVNQSTVESDTSALVKDMLAAANVTDFATGAAAEAFEVGGRVPVLRRGVFFAARSNKLYDLYERYDSLDDLPRADRDLLEKEYFRRGLDEVWAELSADPDEWSGGSLQRARNDEHLRMALVFRWYLRESFGRAQRVRPPSD